MSSDNMRQRIPSCPHGAPDRMDIFLLLSLEKLESDMQIKFDFLSGYRCKECNEIVGGVKNSAHLRGKAVDISVRTSGFRYRIIEHALRLGFQRIGIGRTIIHLDIDTSLPAHVTWLY